MACWEALDRHLGCAGNCRGGHVSSIQSPAQAATRHLIPRGAEAKVCLSQSVGAGQRILWLPASSSGPCSMAFPSNTLHSMR